MPDGRLLPVRCGAPNRCRYCAYLTAVENSAVIGLDARSGAAPTLGITLTTATPMVDSKLFAYWCARLWKWLRAECDVNGWGRIEYLGFIEYTTGRGKRSGGQRRMHMHCLVKGAVLDEAEAKLLEGWLSREWLRITGDSWLVDCRPLRTAAGAIAYLANHHHKLEQRPPEGWRGRRLRPSKGYYERPIADMRAEVREQLAARRMTAAVERAIGAEQLSEAGLPEDEIGRRVDEAMRRALLEADAVQLVSVVDDEADVFADAAPTHAQPVRRNGRLIDPATGEVLDETPRERSAYYVEPPDVPSEQASAAARIARRRAVKAALGKAEYDRRRPKTRAESVTDGRYRPGKVDLCPNAPSPSDGPTVALRAVSSSAPAGVTERSSPTTRGASTTRPGASSARTGTGSVPDVGPVAS
jgi:hypothetical protein